MESLLFFINIPYNCSDSELQEWVESRGIEIASIRMIRDLVTGVSPAFAYVSLKDQTRLEEAILILNGNRLGNQFVTVRRASPRARGLRHEEDR
jgi:RNA recognition motif-containing protein